MATEPTVPPPPVAEPAPRLPDIPAAVRAHKLRTREQWPVRANRASALGHPCERHLTYMRTSWQLATLPGPDLLFIFDEGKLHEEAVLQVLREAGFKVIEQQRPCEYREHQITGHIDCKVLYEGQAIPVEVKSTSPYTWGAIETVADLWNHQHYYVRAWPAQMTMYLLLSGHERGLLLLKNKVTGQLKQIVIDLDFGVAEELVQKAQRVNQHVIAGTLPDRIPYDSAICGDCAFFHICLPDQYLQAPTWEDDPELVAMIQRHQELKSAVSEYERIDKQIKARLREAAAATLEVAKQAAFVIGDFFVTVTKRHVRAYEVPERVDQVVKIEPVGAAPRAKEVEVDA